MDLNDIWMNNSRNLIRKNEFYVWKGEVLVSFRLRQDDQTNASVLEPFFDQVRERMGRGFKLKQLCRMKIRSILGRNRTEDFLAQIRQLNDLSERNRAYLTYNLEGLLADPERFVNAHQPHNEPIWNSTIPPPPMG